MQRVRCMFAYTQRHTAIHEWHSYVMLYTVGLPGQCTWQMPIAHTKHSWVVVCEIFEQKERWTDFIIYHSHFAGALCMRSTYSLHYTDVMVVCLYAVSYKLPEFGLYSIHIALLLCVWRWIYIKTACVEPLHTGGNNCKMRTTYFLFSAAKFKSSGRVQT